jgi:osmotically-inducible protein OsmY
MSLNRTAGAALAVLALSAALPACAPLLIGGAAVGSAMMAADRRTSGAQIDDQGIELKAGSRIKEAIGGLGHVNATSFNRTVLLTGQVSSEAEKSAAEAAVAKIENVRSTINELTIGANSSFSERSSDSLITTRVKASFIDARDIFASAYKVVTERGAVYLMGRVTEREAIRATEIARGVSGVTKVVKAFEIITEAELAQAQTAVKDQPKVETATPTNK